MRTRTRALRGRDDALAVGEGVGDESVRRRGVGRRRGATGGSERAIGIVLAGGEDIGASTMLGPSPIQSTSSSPIRPRQMYGEASSPSQNLSSIVASVTCSILRPLDALDIAEVAPWINGLCAALFVADRHAEADDAQADRDPIEAARLVAQGHRDRSGVAGDLEDPSPIWAWKSAVAWFHGEGRAERCRWVGYARAPTWRLVPGTTIWECRQSASTSVARAIPRHGEHPRMLRLLVAFALFIAGHRVRPAGIDDVRARCRSAGDGALRSGREPTKRWSRS